MLARVADFWKAIDERVFCPLGDGVVEFAPVLERLGQRGYEGFMTIEQDRVPGRGSPLADLRASVEFPQITRHNCVEGWSFIAKWRGVQLAQLLDLVRLKPEARYIQFLCYDHVPGTVDFAGVYYESVDLEDAYHPQTILAYDMNDEPLPIAHGAPIRARIERQLGYKSAKYISFVWATDRLNALKATGKGGFWEDYSRYEWYAGI